jgi:regulatory protein
MEVPTAQTERERALQLAYQALGRRERTVAELRICLESKRVGPEAIEAAVEELQASGLLDDARYARRFAEDKRTLDRWGSERIEVDLRRRGVDPAPIEEAVGDRDRGAELASAVVLLEERFAVPPHDDQARDKAWRLLVRRGYAPELAYEAVRAHERRAYEQRAA